jgi:iduronate 2-sulfatase
MPRGDIMREVFRFPLGLLTVLVFVGSSIDAAEAEQVQKLNVLLIVSDDLNNDLACYGNQVVKSPQIDRLARRGVRFDRAYCQYPVCNPSRTSFLSGRRPGTTGVVDNLTPTRANLKDATFLPQHFRQQGYTTVKVGKIYHTGDPFEDPISWDSDTRETSDAKRPPSNQIASRTPFPGSDTNREFQGIVLDAADEDTYDGMVARKSVEFMEKAVRGDKPFFLAVGFRRPHTPYIAPKKYFELYPPQRLAVPAEPADHLRNIPAIAFTYQPGAERPGPDEARRGRAAYYASLSFMDAQVGVLLDALDRLKFWDNTVVVFMSDHGYHVGEHGGLWHKMTLFEESARVPLIVAAPGRKSNASCPRLVELVDVYPTLAELCGLSAPKGVEGTSFVPLLENPDQVWKKAAFTEVSRAGALVATQKLDPTKMSHSVRTERWRYTEWHTGDAELYDHDGDPKEYRNLAREPKYAGVVAEMKKMLKDGWKAVVPPAK